MRKKHSILICLCLLIAMVFQGCGGGCPPYNTGIPNGRFRIFYEYRNTGCQTLRCPRRDFINVTADSSGVIRYSPDEDGNCDPRAPFSKLDIVFISTGTRSFFAQSAPYNLQAVPSSITFEGGAGLNNWYGMPMISVFNDRGILVDLMDAYDMGANGDWTTVPMPNMTGQYSGSYYVEIANKRYDGGYEVVGTANFDCYGNDRPDNDGDGWYADQDCDDNDPNVNPGMSPDCSGIYYDANCNGQSDYDECFGNPGECCGPHCYCY